MSPGNRPASTPCLANSETLSNEAFLLLRWSWRSARRGLRPTDPTCELAEQYRSPAPVSRTEPLQARLQLLRQRDGRRQLHRLDPVGGADAAGCHVEGQHAILGAATQDLADVIIADPKPGVAQDRGAHRQGPATA